jgi:recombinational DNA repair protein RecR
MQPISDMPSDEFMKLQSLYAAELPICPICTLEDARQALSWLIFESPKDETSERVRQAMEGLLFVVTGALVSNRTEAEQDDQASH